MRRALRDCRPLVSLRRLEHEDTPWRSPRRTSRIRWIYAAALIEVGPIGRSPRGIAAERQTNADARSVAWGQSPVLSPPSCAERLRDSYGEATDAALVSMMMLRRVLWPASNASSDQAPSASREVSIDLHVQSDLPGRSDASKQRGRGARRRRAHGRQSSIIAVQAPARAPAIARPQRQRFCRPDMCFVALFKDPQRGKIPTQDRQPPDLAGAQGHGLLARSSLPRPDRRSESAYPGTLNVVPAAERQEAR